MVDEGVYESVDERLPSEPAKVKVEEGIGEYGGTWHRAEPWGPSHPTWQTTNLYEPFVRWNPKADAIVAGIAKEWSFNDDGTVFTMKLREGIKWSDGAPYTADDFMFWWEDMALNDEHPDAPPAWAVVNEEFMEVEKVNAFELKFTFAGPNWLFPYYLATGFWNAEMYNTPKHYLSQFHPEYNEDVTNYDTLVEKDNPIKNTELPVLNAWRTVEYVSGQRLVAERNPYYWKVDVEGNQLPYIDKVEIKNVMDMEAFTLEIMSGNIDLQFRPVQLTDFAVLKSLEEENDYQILQWPEGAGSLPVLNINWSHPDKEIRDLLRNHDFRAALSYAINRERINQIIWDGLGEARQATISPQSWHFNSEEGQKVFQEWENSYAEFDLDKAESLLDGIGLVDTDNDGWREMTNGEQFTLTIMQSGFQDNSQASDTNELVKEMWEKLGVKTIIHAVSGADAEVKSKSGEWMINASGMSELDLFTYPAWVFPVQNLYWHPKVGQWYETAGQKGEKPVPGGPMDKLINLYKEIKQEDDPEARHQLVLDAIRVHIEEGPFMIGTVGEYPLLVVKKNNVHNVPEPFLPLGPWAPGSPGNMNPCQFFIEQ